MKPCIFCSIAAKEAEASLVFEDDSFLILMDAYPLTEGHVLVIPKRHVQRLHELNAVEQQQLFDLAHQVIEAQKKCGWGTDGTNLLLNDGKAANQTVPHLHLHLIPRKKNDLFSALPKLALHISGLFGFGIDRVKLNNQAEALAEYF